MTSKIAGLAVFHGVKILLGKRRIIIIQRNQYGYLTDTLKIAERLSCKMDVGVICFDVGLPKFRSENVSVFYVSRKSNYFFRATTFIYESIKLIRSNSGAILFIVYFPFCFLLALFERNKSILDFRTGALSKNRLIRVISDKTRFIHSLFFNNITLVSNSLRKHLGISCHKSSILPLGAEEISSMPKVFDEPRLLYIGSLNHRNIEQTVYGLAEFLDNFPEYRSKISYDIIGDGPNNEIEEIAALAKKLDMRDIVNLHGRLDHSQSKLFFDRCNVGVSYVPLTPYYDHQPPTKTFEYVHSGIPVIATRTYENRLIINEVNGVLCDDNASDFARCVNLVIEKFPYYKDSEIRSSLAEFHWDKISQKFYYYIESLYKK